MWTPKYSGSHVVACAIFHLFHFFYANQKSLVICSALDDSIYSFSPLIYIRLISECLNAAEIYTKRMFQLLQSAYSTIALADTALFLGMSEHDATSCMFLYFW